MKRILLITILFLSFNSIFSQHGKMGVYKNDGSIEIINSTEIDSIIFSDYFTCPGLPDVTYEGKIYHTVAIGEQCWLRENLDVGTRIDGVENQTDNNPDYIEKYCFDDLESNCETYGGLYQWNEAMQYVTTEGAQGICPNGWHIPTYSDYYTLLNTVNGDGNALKAIGQGTGTNTSGFSVLMTGWRDLSGNFWTISAVANIWCSYQVNAGFAFYLGLPSIGSWVDIISDTKNYGYSVRCIQD